MFATFAGGLELVKLLISRKANVNHRNKYGDTALIWASTDKNPNANREVVVELIRAGARVNIENAFHVTALMEAANAGYKDIVKELLKTGCKLTKALKYAKKSGNDVIAALIENEPKRRLKMGGKLLDAIKTKNAKRVLGALKMGAPANTLAGEEKHSALMKAVLSASLPIIKHLLKFGAKINHQNLYGETALIWACSDGHLDITRELLKQKADVTLENKYKVNALIEAANRGNADIVTALLKGGARQRDPKRGKKTALYWAKRRKHKDIVALLHRALAGREWCRILAAPDRFLGESTGDDQKSLLNFFVQCPGLRRLVGGAMARFYDPFTADCLEEPTQQVITSK